MSQRIQGRIASDVFDGQHFTGLVGYRVEMVLDHDNLIGGRTLLGSGRTKAEGMYQFTYRRDPSTAGNHRRLEIVVKDVAGRIVRFRQVSPESTRFIVSDRRIRFTDVDDEQITAQDFVVFATEATGFNVTLGTAEVVETHGPGEVMGGAAAASGHGLSAGNAVQLLADKDVFVHVSQLVSGAQHTLLLSMYNFSLPPKFNATPTEELTKVIIDFHAPIPDATHLRRADADDRRPERLLLLAADKGVDIRMVFHAWGLSGWVKVVLGILLFPFIGSDGVFALGGPFDFESAHDEARRYFSVAGRPNIKIRPFAMSLTGAAVMHARMMVADGLEAMCFGASLVQAYVDTEEHAIDAPVRGGTTGFPHHDVGIRIKGPAVGDLHENLRMLWNTAAQGERVDTLDRNPPIQSSGGDGVCPIQVVRTIPAGRFGETTDPVHNGEQGIFEGYLRAIAMADILLYIENQYLIDCRISDAIVNVMKERPQLQVIVLLNICPDFSYFLYPFRQRRLITAIRRAIGETPDDPTRFGVFTRWTHEMGQPRPRMLPVYIHAKAAIVDDRWASVGSANIDYASMDRAVEVNANLLSDGLDAGGNAVPDLLRRKLWAEHLGFVTATGAPDPEAADLQKANIPPDGWLGLWKKRAAAARKHLRDHPSQSMAGMARVLPWPSDNTTHKTPRDYLSALGIVPHKVVPLKSTRPFDFATGQFVPGSKARMDF